MSWLIMISIFVAIYCFCIITLWMHQLFIIIILWHKVNFHFQITILPKSFQEIVWLTYSPLLLCSMYLSINAHHYFFWFITIYSAFFNIHLRTYIVSSIDAGLFCSWYLLITYFLKLFSVSSSLVFEDKLP